SRLLEHEHEVDLVEPEATERLRRDDTEHSHLGERSPRRRASAGRRAPCTAHRRRRAFLAQQIAHGIAQRELLVGEGEVHRGYLRGRPSTRSATTLRWISLVPA